MEDEKNELQKTEQMSPLANAAALVAADGNMDVEKLGKLLEMQERYDATQAKKAFIAAMAKFKENPPTILKDQSVSYGNTKYKHATLGNVTAVINKALCEHGLTASWQTGQADGQINVICRITHVDGHSEETSLSAGADTSGSKNPIQAIGSTITYLQRYTLLALTGLATYDQDDDGAGAGKPELKLPDMTDANKETMQAIYAVLEESLDAGLTLDHEKVCNIFYAQKGSWPGNPERAGVAAAWLIGLKMEENWTKPAK